MILAELSVLLLLYFCAKEVVFLIKQFYNSYITGKTRKKGINTEIKCCKSEKFLTYCEKQFQHLSR